MNPNDFISNPAMQRLSPQKKTILYDLIRQADGLPMDKAMPLMMQTNAKMKAMGLTFTKDESELMMDILTRNMSSAERNKLEAIKKLMPKK